MSHLLRRRGWLLLGVLLLSGCRHIPTPACRKGCVTEQEECRGRGGNWWDCSTVFDYCIAACPSAN